jgi:hypothetical protein
MCVGIMKSYYFAVAAAAFAAAAGGVYAWPAAVPEAPAFRPMPLPAIVTPPNESPVAAAPAKWKRGAKPPAPLPASIAERIPDVPKDPLPPLPVMPPTIESPKDPLPPLPVMPPTIESPKDPLPPLPLPILQTAQHVAAVPPPQTPTIPSHPGLPAAPAKPMDEPKPLSSPTPFTPPAPPNLGTIVLLRDGKLVEGTVRKEGGKVAVHRGSTHRDLEPNDVLFIGKSKDECYQFQRGKLKPDDAPGHYKLARWCMFNGLREQALVEAKGVVKLQPGDRRAADLARTLEESLRLFNADGTPKGGAAPPPPPASLLPTVVEPAPDIPAEAAKVFSSQVQPVLVSLCADCHAKPSYSGSFKMACGNFENDRSLARFNLNAAVKQIKKDQPAASPLLVKALNVHGGMKQAAFANGAAPAYRNLEAWVYAAANAKVKPPALPALPPPNMTPEAKKPALPPPPKPEGKPLAPAVPALPQPPVVPTPVPVPKLPAPSTRFGESFRPGPSVGKTSEPTDEFDPAPFNRNPR